ncbi:hypothetical protein LM500065_110381 [Listeria monocytogenes]|nr:hypothetical protein LM500065_110381 [Listeria monocytogenes]CUL36897.1 hypothetical protein LM7414_90442 [Listeria monocytogenes]CUL43518.1 hypothetical protein LM7422_140445 [Listeria monocytogenes]CUL58740.1 hypothetical protein LM7456_170173 [Listeria monocytogenes]CUL85073.1 hypothetical protein LM7425_160173 [Listeria monocytogenes]
MLFTVFIIAYTPYKYPFLFLLIKKLLYLLYRLNKHSVT